MPGLTSALGSAGAIAGGPVGLGAAAAIQAAIGVGSLIKKGKQNHQADDMEQSLIRPIRRTPQQLIDNQALAERNASQGISDAAMTVLQNNAGTAQATSLDAFLRGGGDISGVAAINDASEERFAQIALIEDEIRRKNEQVLMQQNNIMAEDADTNFQVNEWAPYKDKLRAIQQLRSDANANGNMGWNMIGGAVNNFATGNKLKSETNSVFPNSGQGNNNTAYVSPPPFRIPGTLNPQQEGVNSSNPYFVRL